MTLPTERLEFSVIPRRPALSLRVGARLVVWVIVNVEEWDPTQPMPRAVLTPPAGGAPMPDIPNWAWREYGNRVGFWRMLEALDQHKNCAMLAINGSASARYEPIARAGLDRRWEFIGHGFTQRSMQKIEDEREDILAAAKVQKSWQPPYFVTELTEQLAGQLAPNGFPATALLFRPPQATAGLPIRQIRLHLSPTAGCRVPGG